MIISHKYKFIYIRTPKTASTSIEKFLLKVDPGCICSDINVFPYGHDTLSEIKTIISNNIFNNYFKFTFMRNPNNWILSHLCDNLINKSNYKKFNELKLFLNDDGCIPSPIDNIIDEKYFINYYLFIDKWFERSYQSLWIDDTLDFIGQFENIDTDFNRILKKLNINTNYKLEKINQSSSNKYKLSEKAEKIFNILYENDIKLYNNLFN